MEHQLTLGVIGLTSKENERRLPIHPDHFERIDPNVRELIYLEHGYGEHFGVSDVQLSAWVAGMRTRAELIAVCDVILLLKPDARDLAELRTGQCFGGGRIVCRTPSSPSKPLIGGRHSSPSKR